jgi:hypothetical protein
MKTLLFFLLSCLSLTAQTLTFSIHDNTGATPDTALPAAYQFDPTPQGSSSTIMLKLTNSGPKTVMVVLAYVGATPGSPTSNDNYTVTNFGIDRVLAPNASEYFYLNFTPSTTGQLLGYLQVTYAVQQNGCVFSSIGGTPCAGITSAVSTLEGTGTSPQISLTYDNGNGTSGLQPNAASRLDFGNISTSSNSAITFTLTNQTSQSIATPNVSINAGVYASSAFALDAAALPTILQANATATFRVVFSPGQTGLTTAVLNVGSNSYGIQGTGVVKADVDALQIYYVDSSAVRTSPQAATPISFGQIVPGAGSTLTFTVTNPGTSYDPVSLSALSVSGSGYTLSGGPALPASIQPNASIQFTLTFNASASGTYAGKLTIGTRIFSLTALATVPTVPSMSIQVNPSPLTSAQQATVSIQAASPSTEDVIGLLEMSFSPTLSGVTDDPAVQFLSTGGRKLQVTLATGKQAATFAGQSAIAFQTGTTAGTLTFTLTFPNTAPLVQSFSVTPSRIFITNALAQRQDPALVVTITGYDNTYTAGKMSFTFFDLKGNQIGSGAVPVDATANFHNYFFTNNPAGGSFGMTASFPVTGDITQIGSVGVTLSNTAGDSTTSLTFQ